MEFPGFEMARIYTFFARIHRSRRHAEGRESGLSRSMYMMKARRFFLWLVLLVALLAAGCAMASSTDPIVCSIEIAPSRLAGPGTVNVTITISNSGDTDLTDPVVLYDPTAQIVSDFGENGAAILSAGESQTWTGTYEVNQRPLDNGYLAYFAKYTRYTDSGEAVDTSQAIRATISLQEPESDIDVTRTISPTIAREDQSVVIRYDIVNAGTIALNDVTIQEHEDVDGDVHNVGNLEPGQSAIVRMTVTMGTEDLTSGATITYTSEVDDGTQTYTVENTAITYGEPALEATLTSSSRGVVANSSITLTLELKNTGTVDYSDIRVTDPALGDVFTNQQLQAGRSLTLEREVTLTETMNYQFTVTAVDSTGNETVVAAEPLTVTAVSPEDVLSLNVTVTPNRTEVFESPGEVRFTILIENTSNVDAQNVIVSHGDTQIYTYATIPAGQSRTLNRDAALSMAGKYRFTVTATDTLENTLTFESNEVQIAFSVPTAAPVTVAPAAPTPEPTFNPMTVPPITDASIGAVPKTVQSILLPVLIVAGVLLAASCVLLLIALIRRAQKKKAAKDAIDQLERVKRRDYAAPVEPEEEAEPLEADHIQQEEEAVDDWSLPSAGVPDVELPEVTLPRDEDEEELPHLKFVRNAAKAHPQAPEEDSDSPMNTGYYDEDMTSGQYDGQPDATEAGEYADDAPEPAAYDDEDYAGDGYDPAAYSDEAYADLGDERDAPDDSRDAADSAAKPAHRALGRSRKKRGSVDM